MSKEMTIPETPSLTGKQIKAVDFFVIGMSKNDIADALNVNLRTVYRWEGSDGFQEELKKRQKTAQVEERIRDAIAATKQTSPDQLQVSLQALAREKEQTRAAIAHLGKKFLSKAINRLKDLPDEAVTPQLVPQYADIAVKLIRYAHEEWAEELALQEMIEQLVNGEG